MLTRVAAAFGTLPTLPLPDGAVDDIKMLIESYDRLALGSKRDHAGSDLEIGNLKRRVQEPQTLRWSDLAQAELCTIDVLDDAEIRPRLESWRRRMREVIGETRYAAYVLAAIDIRASTTTPEMLRAELAECINTVNYFYGAYGVAARSRSSVTASLVRFAVSTLVLDAAIAAALAYASRFVPGLPVGALDAMLATSAAAVVGSIVSVQRRLQDPKIDVDPFYRFIQTSSDPLGITFVSVLFAAIFGLVVYGLLLSGFIAGTGLPKLDGATGVPVGASQFSLLLVYGFLAGFAEQFVPDALTRIAARTLRGIAGDPPARGGGDAA